MADVKEYTTVRDATLESLAENMTALGKLGWVCETVVREKKNRKFRWAGLMVRDVAVTEMGPIGGKNVGKAKTLHWGGVRECASPELPRSEQRALAGDPAAYRATNEPKQKEPDPQS